MREFEELSFGELGARLEVSEEAARMRFHRALPKLAHKVAELRGGGISRLLAARADAEGGDAPGAAR